jgi:diguanylate cyclase (GGDEF)-like protein/PAS domain S-box-containing protein
VKSCDSLTLQIANLPIPLSTAFTSDELALIIGTCQIEAVFVIDAESGMLVAANPRFLELVGKTAEEVQAAETPFDRLVYPEDRPLFSTWHSSDFAGGSKSFELRLLGAAGHETAMEISLVPIRWIRRNYLLGFSRKVEDRKNLEREWKREIDEQKKKTLEAIKSSIRIYQITEKIKRTLALTKSLLNTENEAQLFESAARILTGDGLNYRNVTFLLVNENQLEIRHSTKPFSRGHFLLSQDNRYARFVRQNFQDDDLPRDEVLVPLRSRGHFLGLIEVSLFTRERIFFDDLRLVSEWQKNVLFTIGDIIGLHLDNLRLYGEVKRQSVIDPLTGAFNRHYLMARLSAEINRSSRSHSPVSVIFIDVDELKPINDAHTHLQGDQVLRELGAILRNHLREADCVCRYGGDEFVVLLPDVDGDRARRIGEKLLAAVRGHQFKLLDSPGQSLPVSVSLGVSTLVKEQDEDSFLKAADAALYRAKKLGRNRCEYLGPAERAAQ